MDHLAVPMGFDVADLELIFAPAPFFEEGIGDPYDKHAVVTLPSRRHLSDGQRGRERGGPAAAGARRRRAAGRRSVMPAISSADIRTPPVC